MVPKGDLPLEITWLHNDYPLMDDSSVSVLKSSSRISGLTFESLDDRHRGTYTCIAKNKAGRAKFSTDLNING